MVELTNNIKEGLSPSFSFDHRPIYLFYIVKKTCFMDDVFVKF